MLSSSGAKVKLVVHSQTKWAELFIDGFPEPEVLPFEEFEVLDD